MHINRARFAGEVEAPHHIQQLFAAEHDARDFRPVPAADQTPSCADLTWRPSTVTTRRSG